MPNSPPYMDMDMDMYMDMALLGCPVGWQAHGLDCYRATERAPHTRHVTSALRRLNWLFELRYNGLMIVLREANVLGEHAAPLHQIAWGVDTRFP